MIEALDGPSKQLKIAVTNATVVEAKASITVLSERKVVTLIPDGKIYVYFGDGTTPSVSTVQNNGFVIPKGSKDTFEAGDKQQMFLLAVSTTVNIVVIERA